MLFSKGKFSFSTCFKAAFSTPAHCSMQATNTALLKSVSKIAGSDHRVTVFAGVADLPVFSPDAEQDPLPLPVGSFIDLMQEHMQVYEFAGAEDHRLRQLEAAPVYYHPLNRDAEQSLSAAWGRLTGGAVGCPETIQVQGRDLTLPRTAAGVAWDTFDHLCGSALGAADYLQVAQAFQTLILENVPVMGPDMRNEAKRFVTLIDALYETRTKLIVSADSIPQNLYESGTGAFEFDRTVSRLIEMQSRDYLSVERIA